MIRTTPARLLAAAASSALLLSACGAAADDESGSTDQTVTVTDNHGEIEVPVDPASVVALDNTAFETLSAFGVELTAAPKQVMGSLWPEYTEDESVLDVGAHFEPDLEAVVEAEPDLIIGGYRFAELYDDLKEIQPATVETTVRDGEDHAAELIRQTELLGQIFDAEEKADEIIGEFEDAIADAQSAYNGEDTVVGLLTSAGEISYSAPGEGRGVGVLYPTLDLVPGLAREAEDADHGDDISLEAIADADPDWLIVLDRDGAFQEDGYQPAEELIGEAEALQNVTAVQKDQIVYLDPNFYLDEGIQAYTALYRAVADAFEDAS